MSLSQITILPVDNGDSIMIEHDDCIVITDLNYRKDSQDDDDECYDIGEDIRDACHEVHNDYECDLFVLTHPDEDHRRGFEELFFTGNPSNWQSSKSDILIHELWVSKYMDDDNNSTDGSKFLFEEVSRRKKLIGSDEGNKAGNRIKIFTTSCDNTNGSLGKHSNLEWSLLAPTNEEADIESGSSSNDSSLVIQWNAKVDGADNLIMIGGDSGVDIWERLWKDYQDDTDQIKWQILVAPHHCSRSSMARKDIDSDKYSYSDDALNALGVMDGNGFICSSSNKIVISKPNPPSYDAKRKYLDILHKSKSDGEKRFFCTGNHDNGKPGPVVFNFTGRGVNTKIVPAATSDLNSNRLTDEASTYGKE